MTKKLLFISSGEPAGIGPDLCLMLAQEKFQAYDQQNIQLIVLGDQSLFQQRAKQLNLAVNLLTVDPYSTVTGSLQKNQLLLWHLPTAVQAHPGTLNQANASYVLNQLKLATQACMKDQDRAFITCPVQKSIINQAGQVFSGHTEYLQELTQAKRTVMMLANHIMRVVLVTTHLPLKAVPAAITKENLTEAILITGEALKQHFGIVKPRITIAGLNPHAGENSYLGTEEREVIIPVIESLNKYSNWILRGPVAADTMFSTYLKETDCFMAMYHDQGLATVKYADFTHTVNITLGLPFIRTSVDHGTALNLAGTGKADPSSLLAAIDYAVGLLRA